MRRGEGAGLVQPGEEMAFGGPNSRLAGGLSRRWSQWCVVGGETADIEIGGSDWIYGREKKKCKGN